MTDSVPADSFEVGERMMEVHLQKFVANNLDSIIPNAGATLVGTEVVTGAGRIDVLAQDGSGRHWVIEAKVGMAGRDAVAQLQSYLAASKELGSFKGIDPVGVLVAEDFDKPCLYAMQQVPSILAVQYSVTFSFAKGADNRARSVEPVSGPTTQWVVDVERRVFYPKGLRQVALSLNDRVQVAERLGSNDIEIYVGSNRLGRYRRLAD